MLFDNFLENLQSPNMLVSCGTSIISPYMKGSEKMAICALAFAINTNYISDFLGRYIYEGRYFAGPQLALATYQVTSAIGEISETNFGYKSKLAMSSVSLVFGDVLLRNPFLIKLLLPSVINLYVNYELQEDAPNYLIKQGIFPFIEATVVSSGVLPWGFPMVTYSFFYYNILSNFLNEPAILYNVATIAALVTGDWIDNKIDTLLYFFTDNPYHKLINEIGGGQYQYKIEEGLVTNAHLQLNIALFHKFLLLKAGEFAAIARRDAEKPMDFYFLAGSLLAYNTVELFGNLASFVLGNKLLYNFYNLNKKELLGDKYAENIIIMSHQNYTTDQYLHDLEDLTKEIYHLERYIVKDLVALSNLYSMNTHGFFLSAGIGALNLLTATMYTFLNDLWQYHEKASRQCHAGLHRTINHLSANAENFLKLGGKEVEDITCSIEKISFMSYKEEDQSVREKIYHSVKRLLEQIYDFIDCDDMHMWKIDSLVAAIQELNEYRKYTSEVLSDFIGAYLLEHKLLKVQEFSQFKSGLNALFDILTFNIKHQKEFSEMNLQKERLREFLDNLNSIKPYGVKLNLDTCEEAGLRLKNYDIVRIDGEREFTLHVDELELQMGKIYAVIGPNGSGKSSLLSSIYLAILNKYAPSFKISGELTASTNHIEYIPQQDVCPLNSSLYEIIMFPFLKSGYEEQILNLLRKFKVFEFEIDENYLYMEQENWFANLSGGQKKLLQLIGKLISCPDILILDETFAPLGEKSQEQFFEAAKETCLKESMQLIITHDISSESLNICEEVKAHGYDEAILIDNGTVTIIDCEG